LKLLIIKKNLGFSKAVNIGIKKLLLDKEITDILLLNNDVILKKNTLDALVENNVDILSPVIRFIWGKKPKYDYGGKINYWTGRPSHIERDDQEKIPSVSIDYVSGCCMRIKKRVLDKIGLFDEQFFFYFEDIDFCIRAKSKGFSIAVEKKSTIDHGLSQSIGRSSNRAIYYNLVSNAKFINKHLGCRKIFGFLYLLLLLVKILLNKVVKK
jgi:GT2 family glycosyltransferase